MESKETLEDRVDRVGQKIHDRLAILRGFAMGLPKVQRDYLRGHLSDLNSYIEELVEKEQE